MATAIAIYFSGRNEKLNFYNDMLELAKSRYKNKIYHAGE
jgi:hypothetical protein